MDRVLIDLAQGTSGIRVQAGTGGPGCRFSPSPELFAPSSELGVADRTSMKSDTKGLLGGLPLQGTRPKPESFLVIVSAIRHDAECAAWLGTALLYPTRWNEISSDMGGHTPSTFGVFGISRAPVASDGTKGLPVWRRMGQAAELTGANSLTMIDEGACPPFPTR